MKKITLLVSLILLAVNGFAQITIPTDATWRCFPLVPIVPGPPYPGPASYSNPPDNPAFVQWTQVAHNDAAWAAPAISPGSSPSNLMWPASAGPQIWASAFRKTFSLTTTSGFHRIIVLADNFADIYVNGTYIGLADWSTPDTFCIPSNILNVGNNVIAIKGGEYVNSATYVSALAVFNNPTPFPCSPQPVCSDTCFWKVTGNNIISNNIFGTLTNDNVRLFTNNTSRGIFTNTGRFGFGTSTPGNRVEINHTGNGTSGNTGFSGLRFSNMNSASVTQPNPQGKVLSVDAAGDVILVMGGGGGGSVNANNGCSYDGVNVQLGQKCDGSGAELLEDREIPLNEHNIIFKDGKELSPNMNRMGIGITTCMPDAKLDVVRALENSQYDPFNRAISGINLDFSERMSIGVYGEANFRENRNNAGGYFYGKYALENTYGVIGIGESHGGKNAFGGWFSACEAERNIGVYAEACNSDNGGGGPSWAGYFNGDVFSTTGYFASDRNIKKNIEPITNSLDLLSRIQPRKYEFDVNKYPGLHLPTTKDNYGVIAQELEEVLPSLVKETAVPDGNRGYLKETIKTVNYTELIPILIQAVKDQQTQIQEQQAQINELKAAIKNDDKTNASKEAVSKIEVVLSDKNVIVLNQNIPNPCDKFTAIGFNIPVSVKSAIINFTTMEGKLIKSLTIAERGKGVLDVFTSDLTPGTYIYTLVADGQSIDSKRMAIK